MNLTNKVVVLLSDDQKQQIADFRWKNRIRSENEAMRQLMAKGLEAANEKADAEPASA